MQAERPHVSFAAIRAFLGGPTPAAKCTCRGASNRVILVPFWRRADLAQRPAQSPAALVTCRFKSHTYPKYLLFTSAAILSPIGVDEYDDHDYGHFPHLMRHPRP